MRDRITGKRISGKLKVVFALLFVCMVCALAIPISIRFIRQTNESRQHVDYKLKVLVVNNDKLETYNKRYIREVLKIAKEIFKKEFGVTIEFTTIDWKKDDRSDTYCKKSFQKLLNSPDSNLYPMVYGDERMVYETLKRGYRKGSFEKAIKVMPLRNKKGIYDVDDFLKYNAISLVKSRTQMFDQIIGIQKLYSSKEQMLSNSFLKYLKLDDIEYDLILTNNIISGLEDNTQYSLFNQGGVLSGIAIFSGNRKTNAVAIASFFPTIYNKFEFLSETYYPYFDDVDKKRELAITIAHELGHSLLHQGHVYNDWNCLMNSIYVSDYKEKEWKRFFNELGSCDESSKFYLYDIQLLDYLWEHRLYESVYETGQKIIDQNPDIDDVSLATVRIEQAYAMLNLGKYEDCSRIIEKFVFPRVDALSADDIRWLDRGYNYCVNLMISLASGNKQESRQLRLAKQALRNETFLNSENRFLAKWVYMEAMFNIKKYSECFYTANELEAMAYDADYEYDNKRFREIYRTGQRKKHLDGKFDFEAPVSGKSNSKN